MVAEIAANETRAISPPPIPAGSRTDDASGGDAADPWTERITIE
jgi:hypothetical protein